MKNEFMIDLPDEDTSNNWANWGLSKFSDWICAVLMFGSIIVVICLLVLTVVAIYRYDAFSGRDDAIGIEEFLPVVPVEE